MRLLLDMCISPETGEWLRSIGHDAVHLREQGLQRLDDDEILAKARAENRVVVTSDLDFAQLVAVGGLELPSVVLLRLSDMRPANVNRHLTSILNLSCEDLLAGAVAVATESRLRMRRLPIGREDD